MRRHVFITLAAVIALATAMPQNRGSPFKFSFSDGKFFDDAFSFDRPAAAPEPALEKTAEPVLETTAAPEVVEVPAPVEKPKEPEPKITLSHEDQMLWKKATMNLAHIPHLLHWVSSLDATEVITELVTEAPVEQGLISEPQDAAIFIQNERLSPETVTEFYEPEYTTETTILDEINADPGLVEEILAIEPQIEDIILADDAQDVLYDQVLIEPAQQNEVVAAEPEKTKAQASPAAQKTTTDIRKSKSKFKPNRKQSLKKGKTLSQNSQSTFSMSSFAFPAFSYSISHQPQHTHFSGR